MTGRFCTWEKAAIALTLSELFNYQYNYSANSIGC
jgi:hypothetical protein